jgi:hypothetical protein
MTKSPQQQRTDTRTPRDLVKQQDDDRSNGAPAGARQQGALGSSRDDTSGAPQSQSTRGTTRDEGNSTAQTGEVDERREAVRERSGGEVTSSQGLAGARGSGGGAERGITQHPDRKDPTSGPMRRGGTE